MKNFFTASITINGVHWRGLIWDNVRFALFKLNGGYQKAEEEYRTLIKGWKPGRADAYEKGFVDCDLFTFDEIVAMRNYFLAKENTKYGYFTAELFLDFPIKKMMSVGAIGVGGGDEEVDFHSQKKLSFTIIGHCHFWDEQVKERGKKEDEPKQEPFIPPADFLIVKNEKVEGEPIF